MFVALCKFSLDPSSGFLPKDRARLSDQIRQTVFQTFRVTLVDVGHEDTLVLGMALVGKREDDLKNRMEKILNCIEEKTGLRLEAEKTEVFFF